MKVVAVFICLYTSIAIANTHSSDFIIGKWKTMDKNASIQIMKKNDHSFCGKIQWFKDPVKTNEHKWTDYNNPNKSLRNRRLFGLKIIDKLTYEGNNIWSGGKLYDPSSGKTYDCFLKKIDNNTIEIIGYWQFRWIGKSITLTKNQ